MKKYTAIFIDTALAAVVCSLFQAIITVLLFARNVGLDIFPAQLFYTVMNTKQNIKKHLRGTLR